MSSWHVNVFRSINRFERKKNLGLAIEALESLLAANAGSAAAGVQHVHLVLAGGYDHLNTENVEHLAELQVLSLSLSPRTPFMLTSCNTTRVQLPCITTLMPHDFATRVLSALSPQIR